MRYLRLFCCVLLCCALLSIAFSSVVSAEESGSYTVNIEEQYDIEGIGSTNFDYDVNPFDNVRQTHMEATTFPSYKKNKITVTTTYSILRNGGGFLVYKDDSATISLNGFWYGCREDVGGGEYWSSVLDSASIRIYYSDGSVYRYTEPTITVTNKLHNFELTFEPLDDVIRIDVIGVDTITINASDNITHNRRIGEFENASYSLKVEQKSDTKGLLATIIDYIKNLPSKIWGFFSGAFSDLIGSITDIYESITTFFENMINRIIELPMLIWNKFKTGLTDLFVPTDEQLDTMFTQMDALLEEKLGCLYQVGSIVYEKWEQINVSTVTGTVHLPKTEIQFNTGDKFAFGGFDVQVVPTGFMWLADIVKGFTSVIFTVAFVNGLRNQYDKVMKGE